MSAPPDPELVLLTARQARRAAPMLFVAQVVIVGMLWQGVSHTALLVWLGCAFVNSVRMFVANHLEIRRFERGGHDDWYVARSVVHGVLSAGIWGVLPVVTERWGTDTATITALLVVLGFLTGVVYGASASLLHFRIAVGAAIAPLLVATAVGFVDPSLRTAVVVGFAAMLVVVHRSVHQLLVAHTEATAENRQLAERLAEALATTDPITRAHRRTGLTDWVAAHPAPEYRLHVVEVERLDAIRWLFGHHAADTVLVEFARRIRSQLDDTMLFVRLSDRQFAIVAARPRAALDMMAEAAVAESVVLDGQPTEIALTVASARCDADSVESVLSDLEIDVHHRARPTVPLLGRSGPDRVERELLAAIPDALSDGSIGAWFQPIIGLGTGAVGGWEALVRWEHPTFGQVSPARLLPLAEASGHLGDVTARMLSQSVGFVSGLVADGEHGAANVHVNVEASDLTTGLEIEIARLLKRHEVSASRLVLEITERSLIRIDEAVVRLLDGLRERGVRIAIDDFGTGYSSLSHLFDIPLDCLKIDRRFVAELPGDATSLSLVRSIVGLAQGFGVSTVAEGVECEVQRSVLRDLGCAEYQGFLAAPALPPDETLRWLRDRHVSDPTAAFA